MKYDHVADMFLGVRVLIAVDCLLHIPPIMWLKRTPVKKTHSQNPLISLLAQQRFTARAFFCVKLPAWKIWFPFTGEICWFLMELSHISESTKLCSRNQYQEKSLHDGRSKMSGCNTVFFLEENRPGPWDIYQVALSGVRNCQAQNLWHHEVDMHGERCVIFM